MPAQAVSILKREFVDFIISTFEKHGLNNERLEMLADFFSYSSNQEVDELRAKLLIKDSNLPEQMTEAFGYSDASRDESLNLAAV